MRRRAAGAALLCLLAACGGADPGGQAGHAVSAPPVEIPVRAATAGDRLLALAPGGADALVEIDLARLRGNQQVGALVRAVAGRGALEAARDGAGGGMRSGEAPGEARSDEAVLAGGARADLVSASDLLLFVSYRVGHADAGQLVLAAGPATAQISGARPVVDQVVAVGSPALLERTQAVAEGREPPLSADRALLRARAMAMPEAAEGASLRVAAHLGFDARVALARELELEAVPVWMSVWLDVADDLAGVALLGGDRDATPEHLARAALRLRKRIEAAPSFRRAGLAQLAASAEIETRAADARIVVVVGPRRLAQLIERVMARLGAP
jgi:hypothetical protein